MSGTVLDLTPTERRHREGQDLSVTAAEIRETLEYAEQTGHVELGANLEDALEEIDEAANEDSVADFNQALKRLVRLAERAGITVRWRK